MVVVYDGHGMAAMPNQTLMPAGCALKDASRGPGLHIEGFAEVAPTPPVSASK